MAFVDIEGSPRIYCGDQCRKLNAGGYREGSGRSKTGYYKGIYSGSTYELVWIIYQLDHNISFKRFPSILKASFTSRRYMLDFLQEGNIIEIKGFETLSSVEEKVRIAKSNGYSVILKYREDLQQEFEYVCSTYRIPESRLCELYDGYKPSYSHICKYCGAAFTNDSPRSIYCSRSCAGKSVSSHNRSSRIIVSSPPFQGGDAGA